MSIAHVRDGNIVDKGEMKNYYVYFDLTQLEIIAHDMEDYFEVLQNIGGDLTKDETTYSIAVPEVFESKKLSNFIPTPLPLLSGCTNKALISAPNTAPNPTIPPRSQT